MRYTKTWIAASFLTVMASVASVAALPSDSHPDGKSVTYRGYGATILEQDRYTCRLYNAAGGEVGSVSFRYFGPEIDLEIGGREAHFLSGSAPFVDFHPLDESVYPNLARVPDEFKADGNALLIISTRSEIGVNAFLNDPVTQFAESISVVEVRCTYIVDSDGLPLYCLNCLYVVS